jgi:hypothetical protein
MSFEEEERLLFPSFLFPESFPADVATATPDSGKSIRLLYVQVQARNNG